MIAHSFYLSLLALVFGDSVFPNPNAEDVRFGIIKEVDAAKQTVSLDYVDRPELVPDYDIRRISRKGFRDDNEGNEKRAKLFGKNWDLFINNEELSWDDRTTTVDLLKPNQKVAVVLRPRSKVIDRVMIFRPEGVDAIDRVRLVNPRRPGRKNNVDGRFMDCGFDYSHLVQSAADRLSPQERKVMRELVKDVRVFGLEVDDQNGIPVKEEIMRVVINDTNRNQNLSSLERRRLVSVIGGLGMMESEMVLRLSGTRHLEEFARDYAGAMTYLWRKQGFDIMEKAEAIGIIEDNIKLLVIKWNLVSQRLGQVRRQAIAENSAKKELSAILFLRAWQSATVASLAEETAAGVAGRAGDWRDEIAVRSVFFTCRRDLLIGMTTDAIKPTLQEVKEIGVAHNELQADLLADVLSRAHVQVAEHERVDESWVRNAINKAAKERRENISASDFRPEAVTALVEIINDAVGYYVAAEVAQAILCGLAD